MVIPDPQVSLETALTQFGGAVDVVLLVVNEAEFAAVSEKFLVLSQQRATAILEAGYYAYFGKVGQLSFVVVKASNMGGYPQNVIVNIVVKNLKPKVIISVGVGWGHKALVEEKGGALADVMVSKTVLDCANNFKETPEKLELRDSAPASDFLVNYFSGLVNSGHWKFNGR